MIAALDSGVSALHNLYALLDITAFGQQSAIHEKCPVLNICETMLDSVVEGFIGENRGTS